MSNLEIARPKDTTISMNGFACTMSFNHDFGKKYTGRMKQAQMFVDSEVLRFCSARVPFQTGTLQKSGIAGSVIGSGVLRWTVPYASRQYYHTSPSRPYDANRGAYWFERGKAQEMGRIMQGARQILAKGRP